MTGTDAERDPTQHLLIWSDYKRRPDGTLQVTPIGLDAVARDFAESITKGRPAELELDPNDGNPAVAFSARRAQVIAALLSELSQRLQPGREVGPIQGDGELSELAARVAWHVRNGTGY